MSFGPKLVVLDQKAIIRRYAKEFVKQISKPGIRSITFIIEREDGVNCQSSKTDPETREVLRKALHVLSGW